MKIDLTIEAEEESAKQKRPAPIGVNLNSEKGREYIHHVVGANIRSGNIPDFMIESDHLIGEGETPEADKILQYVRRVLDRLSMASSGLSHPELKLFLSDQPGIHAGVITDAPMPIMVIGLGLLDVLVEQKFGEDHLANILGHERFHLRRHEKWPHLHNGRPEESIADVYAVLEAQRAGYNPKGVGDVFRYIQNQNYKAMNWAGYLQYVMEHPPTHLRIRNTEVALAGLQLTKRMTDSVTPLPEEVVSLLDSVHFKTHIDRYLARYDYVNAVPDKKIRVVMQYINSIGSRYERFPYLFRLRLAHAGKYLDEFLLAPKTEASKAEARRWFMYFMEHSLPAEGYNGRAHRYILDQLVSLMVDYEIPASLDHRSEVVGYKGALRNPVEHIPNSLKLLATESKKFIEAKTREEAVFSARRLQQARVTLKKYRSGISALEQGERTMHWPQRDDLIRQIRKTPLPRLSWESHARWALGEGEHSEADKAGSALIGEMAQSLGAYDPRFSGYDPDNTYHGPSGFKYEDLTFDPQGNIIAVRPTQYELDTALREKYRRRFSKKKTAAALLAGEYAIQKERDRLETDLVRTTDWNDLEKDFWGFVERNAEHLTPAMTVVSGQHPFAREFIQRLSELAKKSPDVWGTNLTVFILGYDPIAEEKKNKEREKQNSWSRRDEIIKLHPFSMPMLIAAFREKYHSGFFGEGANLHRLRGKLPKDHPLTATLDAIARDPRERRREEDIAVMISKEKEGVQLECAIDANHPYVAAILAADIANPQKIHLIRSFRIADCNTRNIEDYFLIHPRVFASYEPPQTPSEYHAIRRKLEHNTRGEMMNFIDYQTKPIELLLMLRRLQREKIPSRFAISEIDLQCTLHHFDHFAYRDVAERLRKELRLRIERQLSRNKRIDFRSDVPLMELIDRYYDDHGQVDYDRRHDDRGRPEQNIFYTRPDLERAYEAHIENRVMALPVAERAEPLTQILRLNLRFPTFRQWVIDAWVESSALRLGKDDGSASYAKRALKFIENALKTIHSSQAMTCAVRILDKIEAQREVAFATKEALINKFGQQFLSADGGARMMDAAVETCANDPELRKSLLKYLTEPLTFEGSQDFIALLKRRSSEYEYVELMKRLGFENHFQLSPHQEVGLIDYLHQNFWAMPFEIRTIYLDRVLFPPRAEMADIFDEAVAFVYDRALPLHKRFAREAREAISVYLDCCPPELRRVTFSALLASTEQASQSGELRPGQILSFVLTRTGAAGGQLLQAAHSYLMGQELTDPDLIQLRDDLKDNKINFSPPLRWEIFERVDEVLTETERGRIARLGPTLGSGSTAYVVECQKGLQRADGSYMRRTALKLMRKDVISIADLQFERYLEAFDILARDNKYYRPLPDMVKHARNLIQIAANGQIGAKQIRYAAALYDPLAITVGEKQFTFKVAPVLSSGLAHIETALVEGTHFNDLDSTTPEGVAFKEAVAIASEIAEYYNLLRGKAVDQDRHGGQQKIRDCIIGMFDVGSIPYDQQNQRIAEPTEREKYALGQLLGLTLSATISGCSAGEALSSAVTSREWGDAKPYLVGIKRAFLARMDFQSALGITQAQRRTQQQRLIAAVHKLGQTDATILKGVHSTLSIKAGLKLGAGLLLENGGNRGVKIDDRSLPRPYSDTCHRPKNGVSILKFLFRSRIR